MLLKFPRPALILLLISVCQTVPLSPQSFAGEPDYCDPGVFNSKENKALSDFEGLERAHVFKLGSVTLAGLGVGDSDPQAVIDLADRFGSGSKEKQYCTWYLNYPRFFSREYAEKAAVIFIQKNLIKNPKDMNEAEAALEFMQILGETFDEESVSFLSCAKEHGYIALGCNGMRHRGPSVFGMILAFSGCTPEHALKIVNSIWQLNGVKESVRKSIIQSAYELGEVRTESRDTLARLFSEENIKNTK